MAWNVERCVMWNEVRVWAVTWNVERYAMWNEVSVVCGMECGTWCDME